MKNRSSRNARLSSSLNEEEVAQALKNSKDSDVSRKLAEFYGQVKRQILQFQSPTSGLFPRLSSADCNESHIRDTVYCAACVWSLQQAYIRRVDDDNGRAYELGQSVVKCMRGILFSWMRQSSEVELFKTNQTPVHALHSKFELHTGLSLRDLNNYGHLQIDVVSLYLIFLVQMIASGLQIVYTMEEVCFVQNLVYYVERAYRTPDFGMWERGSKYNDGSPEIHSSSIGHAKAALEAINGFNLFGEKGAAWSVIYVDIDAHSRNRSIFETLLPRESMSKNTDASLLPTISWPCFATHDKLLYAATKKKMLRKLKGAYGVKRFLRDGYGSVLESKNRTWYKPNEIKIYENIESEWPLVVCFLIIDAFYFNETQDVKEYNELLMHKLIRRETIYGDPMLPKYYNTAPEYLDDERLEPGSTPKIASFEGSNCDCLFLMGQAVFIITQLLVNCLLHINELDPIKRYLPRYSRPKQNSRYSAFQGTGGELVCQVVQMAESRRLQAILANYGIQTQTAYEVEPVKICSPSQLIQIYEYLGVSKKLLLKGRPPRPIGTLGTSKLYRICGQTILCYPLIFEVSDFYLSHDMALLIDDIINEIHFIAKHWRLGGRPTLCILIREEHVRDVNFPEMLDLLVQFKKGALESGPKIKIGRLQNLISSSCIEHLDFLPLSASDAWSTLQSFMRQTSDESIEYQTFSEFPRATVYNEPLDEKVRERFLTKPTSPDLLDALNSPQTLYVQSQLLGILWEREGQQFVVPSDKLTVRERMEKLMREAGALRHWMVVRYCASLLRKVVDSISPYITSILVNGKQITIGTFGGVEQIIDKPLTPKEIHSLFYSVIRDPYDAVLQQEITIYIGRLISTSPQWFKGILKIRIGSIVEAIKLYSLFKNPSDAPTRLETLAPSQIRKLLFRVLTDDELSVHEKRQIEGAFCRAPDAFYDKVWDTLTRIPGGLMISGQHLPAHTTLTLMSQNELNFALLVEKLLGKINSPLYRQLCIEVIMILSLILERNVEITVFQSYSVDIDRIIQVTLQDYQSHFPDSSLEKFYGEERALTSSFLARNILNSLLSNSTSRCNVS